MTIKKILYGKIKKSKIFNVLPDNIQGKISLKYEKQLYKSFKKHIQKMAEISKELKPQTREECFDRYYINDYVEMNKKYIHGDVLEFAGGDVVYSKKYGNNPNVKIMAALNHKEAYPNADYWADLQNRETLPEQKFDCIVATQVIMYMEDLETTLENLKYMLKPNGHLILTVPGPIFHHSKNSHHMFSFTEESIKFLCKKVFNNYENFKCYGNLEYVQYMLYWMKKNPFEKPVNNQYCYTLVMGIVTTRSNELNKENQMSVLERIFSVKNSKDKTYKIITILGFKFKLKRELKNINVSIQNSKANLEQHLISIEKKLSMPDNIWQIKNTKFYVPYYPIDFIQKHIVNTNTFFEEDILEQLDKYIPDNAVILDIGANIGNHSLYWMLKSSKKVSRIYAFEPVSDTFSILKKNIEINNLQDRVKLFNIGLNDENTTAGYLTYRRENIGDTHLIAGEGDMILKRLDDINIEDTHIDFIKISSLLIYLSRFLLPINWMKCALS